MLIFQGVMLENPATLYGMPKNNNLKRGFSKKKTWKLTIYKYNWNIEHLSARWISAINGRRCQSSNLTSSVPASYGISWSLC